MSTTLGEAPLGPPSLHIANPSALTSLELATGRMVGTEERASLPRMRGEVSLAETLDGILEPALASGRCLVAFSGGRESAFLLASATSCARRHGHPDPIPATLRTTASRSSDAAVRRQVEHQQRIVTFLGLEEWDRVDVGDQLELLGPYARRALAEAGILFPATAYVFLPLLDRARDGWLLAGGSLTDFLLYWRGRRISEVVAGRRRRPTRRDVRELGFLMLPRPVRRALLRSRTPPVDAPWLREPAAREFGRLTLDQWANAPLAFDTAVSRQRMHRCYVGTRLSADALAHVAGARLLMPFRDDRYLAALAALGGRRGLGDRFSMARRVAGGILPDELLVRSEGAKDRYAYVGEASRRFIGRWSGTGLDTEVLDVDVLRASWSADVFPWASAMLLQLAFVHDDGLEG
jgi:asparagine synthase (glutamine-hydrolysing)